VVPGGSAERSGLTPRVASPRGAGESGWARRRSAHARTGAVKIRRRAGAGSYRPNVPLANRAAPGPNGSTAGSPGRGGGSGSGPPVADVAVRAGTELTTYLHFKR